MIERPKLSSGMKRFREAARFAIMPMCGHNELSDEVLRVLSFLWSRDPYRPVGDWILDGLRAGGVRISKKRFDRGVEELRTKGYLEGDQPPRQALATWEESWRTARREAKDPESFTARVYGTYP